MVSRRRFIQQAGAVCVTANLLKGQEEQPSSEDWPVILFEKPVQALSYEEIANEVAAMGLRGLEATIRPTGHILPENAAKELPKMMKALTAAGLDTVIAATRVIEATTETSDFLKILREPVSPTSLLRAKLRTGIANAKKTKTRPIFSCSISRCLRAAYCSYLIFPALRHCWNCI